MTDAVNRLGPRHVADVIPDAAEAAAEVRVLPVEKVTLVESVHLLERIPPGQHARTRKPIDDDTFVPAADCGLADHVASGNWQPRQDPSERAGTSEKPREHVRVAPGATLDRAVCVQNARAHESAV